MAHLFDVLTIAIGLIMTIIGYQYKEDKKRQDNDIKALQDKHEEHIEHVAVLKATAVTDKEVRAIFQECLGPLTASLTEIKADVKEIRHQSRSMCHES